MKLSPAQHRQLQDLYDVQVEQMSSAGKSVNLGTIKSLRARGLVTERMPGYTLAAGTRTHNAYPLTDAGRTAVEKGTPHA